MLKAHGLPEQPVDLKWALHLLLISVYQRSLAVPVLLFCHLQPCAVNGYHSEGALATEESLVSYCVTYDAQASVSRTTPHTRLRVVLVVVVHLAKVALSN